MFWPVLISACLAVALLSWAATAGVLRLLVRLRAYDRPNPRSSHARPTPRGAGLALVPVVAVAWSLATLWLGAAPVGFAAVLVGTVLLAVVSWIDDLITLSVVVRLAAHGFAVAIGVVALGDSGLVFQGAVPFLVDRVAAALLWLWFLNLFNFMDGIDGLSGVESATVGAGLALIAWLAAAGPVAIALPALLAAAVLGFLVWNWEPAKVFLGDVGSIPLGYLLGWMLLLAALEGHWVAALILPLYYLTDAGLTLIRRVLHGASVWVAHRDHFYQRAVRGGLSHSAVVRRVLACDALLVALAALGTVVAPGRAVLALAGAGVAVAALLVLLGRHGRRA